MVESLLSSRTLQGLIFYHLRIPPVFSHEPLNVSLADLRAAGKKGKWWLVGLAWGGDPLVDAMNASTASASEHPKSEPMSTTDEALLKLARKQGMNTEIRRSIFVVLMSSDVRHCTQDGCVDACANDLTR